MVMPMNMMPMLAQLALRNPQQVATILAAQGIAPPSMPANPNVQPPVIQQPAGPSAGVSVQDYIRRGFDPMEFQGDFMMPNPPAGGYRGPVGAGGLAGHTGAAQPPGQAGPVANTPMQQTQQQGPDPADITAALQQIAQPTAQPAQPLPPVGVGIGSPVFNAQALVQALLQGAQPQVPPSLGSLILGG